MNTSYIYLLIFGCIAYLISTDESIAKAVVYISEIVKNKFLTFLWWLVNNPKTPWARYAIHRRSMKMAEELMEEYKK